MAVTFSGATLKPTVLSSNSVGQEVLRACRLVVVDVVARAPIASMAELNYMIEDLENLSLEHKVPFKGRHIVPIASYRESLQYLLVNTEVEAAKVIIQEEVKKQFAELILLTSLEKTAYLYRKLKERLEPKVPALDPDRTTKREYEREIARLQNSQRYWEDPAEVEKDWKLGDLIPMSELQDLPRCFKPLFVTQHARVRFLVEHYGVTMEQLKKIPFEVLATILQTESKLFGGEDALEGGAARGAAAVAVDQKEKTAMGILLKKEITIDRICQIAAVRGKGVFVFIDDLLTSESLFKALEFCCVCLPDKLPDFAAGAPGEISEWLLKTAQAEYRKSMEVSLVEEKRKAVASKLDEKTKACFLAHPVAYNFLLESTVPEDDIVEICKHSQANLHDWVSGVCYLIAKCGIPWTRLKELPKGIAELLIKCPMDLHSLLCAGVSLETILALSRTERVAGGISKFELVMRFGRFVASYIKLGLTLDEIFALDKEDMIYLRLNSGIIQLVKEGGIPLEKLRTLSKLQRGLLCEYSKVVLSLMQRGESFESIAGMVSNKFFEEQLVMIIVKTLGYEKLASSGISLEMIRALNRDKKLELVNSSSKELEIKLKGCFSKEVSS